ncbi:hypothetical protein Droror1_Dr00001105 [Drosera rotundifolia]
MENQSSPPSESESPPSPSTVTKAVDIPLHRVGFLIDELTPSKVSGRLPITEICCQPFRVLHGGVSALVAEGLASVGAHMAGGFKRVAGIHLSINHVKSAHIGDLVYAEATPFSIGRTLQVWDVHLWKVDPSTMKNKSLVSSSRVTLMCNMPVPEYATDAAEVLRKYAKL